MYLNADTTGETQSKDVGTGRGTGDNSTRVFWESSDTRSSLHVVNNELLKVEQRPFVCLICGKRFKSRGHTKAHQRVHTDERPFKCQLCGYTYKTRFCLMRHQKTHDREPSNDRLAPTRTLHLAQYQDGNEYSDTLICGKRVKERCYSQSHQPVHRDERSFKCQLCEYAFKTAYNLRRHQKRHVGEREKHLTTVTVPPSSLPLSALDIPQDKQSYGQHKPQFHIIAYDIDVVL